MAYGLEQISKFMTMKRKLLAVMFGCMIYSFSNAQLTAQQKNEMIDTTIKALNERYIFPDVAKQIEIHLRKQQQLKVYDTITNGDVFAQKLSIDLKAVSKDKHLNVAYSAEIVPPQPEIDLMNMHVPASEKDGYGKWLKHMNYGIRKIDILKGNIGYMDIDFLCDPEFAGDTYAAMMNYFAQTEALIIDLRQCSGSRSPDAIPFICSYFFENPVHLNDIYFRKADSYKQSWTYSYVPGKKYLNKPIYILTSNSTFSGGEELAYDLKNLKRATIIGQHTGGGANPGGFLKMTDHFLMFVPFGRAINPVTKTNWEEVGVQPDTIINTRLALYKAQQLAMTHSINTTDEAEWKNGLQDWLKELEQNKPVFKTVTFELKGFDKAKEVYVTGSFDDWSSTEVKMERQVNTWIATTEAELGKITYKFIVDGNYITDPGNQQTERNGEFINSVRVVN
jgi:hypothetical protein